MALAAIFYKIIFVCLFGAMVAKLPCGPAPLFLPVLLSSASNMCSNAWTTLEEFTYVESLKPKSLAQQERHSVGSWLAHTASESFKKFPTCGAQFNCKCTTMVSILSFLPVFLLLTSPIDIAGAMHMV